MAQCKRSTIRRDFYICYDFANTGQWSIFAPHSTIEDTQGMDQSESDGTASVDAPPLHTPLFAPFSSFFHPLAFREAPSLTTSRVSTALLRLGITSSAR